MKKMILIFSVVLFFIGCTGSGGSNTQVPSIKAQADGTVNGGGGVGIRCGNNIEMLDLYEARAAGLTMAAYPNSQKDATVLVANTLAHHFWNADTVPEYKLADMIASEIINPIFDGKAFKNVKTNKFEQVTLVDQLPLSNDFGSYKIPAGCTLQQVAYFSDAKTQLSIVKSAWEQLDWMSKSVLVAHEMIYLLDRRESMRLLKPQSGVQTSESARKFVGQLLSTAIMPTVSDNMPAKEDLFVCRGVDQNQNTSTYFYAFEDKKSGHLSVVFNMIFNYRGLYQMRSDFKSVSLKQLVDEQSDEPISQEEELISVGSGVATQFLIKLSRANNDSPVFELIYNSNGQHDVVGQSQVLHCDSF